jgi:hypothetical protein
LLAAAGSIATVIGLIAQARTLMNESSDTTPSNTLNLPTLNDVPLGAEGGMARGDRFAPFSAADGGVFDGSSHADGGNAVYDNNTGKQIAEVEKGEAWMVLSKAFTSRNSDQIGTLMEASRRGLRIEFAKQQPLATPSPARVARAMNVVHLAQGGVLHRPKETTTTGQTFTSGTGAMSPSGNGGDGGEMLQIMRQTLEMQQRLAMAMEQYPTRIEAFTVLSKPNDRVIEKWEAKKQRHTVTRRTAA